MSVDCIVSLIGSMADNKAALGRRYGEWAVSAPTLESAVAAAAMAQDELGHARSTYPVIKQLDAEAAADETHGGDRRLAILDEELESWTMFVAVNLLVDGMLTTFVASCADSSIEQLAQRARKILQEEGSHRVHGEAWARRLCRAGDHEREALLAGLRLVWEQAARWPGPTDDAGYASAIRDGVVGQDPGVLRETMRRWLTDLLAAEGATIELPEPGDWARWDDARRRWAP